MEKSFFENINFEETQVDKSMNLIRGVKIISSISKNGRKYTT